jgi:CheY-like chemotaxis protein
LETVLLVDDTASIRRALRVMFESAGYHVCAEAENGAEAIELATKHKPSLIVLDLSMPVMNGLQAAPELRRILPTAPIILFTAHADSILKENIIDVGISSVVAKGVAEGLLEEVQSRLKTVKSKKSSSSG